MTAENLAIASQSNTNESCVQLANLLSRAACEPAWRGQLLADPRGTLQAHGIALPKAIEVIALENTGKLFNLVLPAASAEGELSDAQLEDVSGGVFVFIGFILAISAAVLTMSGVGAAGIGAAGFAAGVAISKHKRK